MTPANDSHRTFGLADTASCQGKERERGVNRWDAWQMESGGRAGQRQDSGRALHRYYIPHRGDAPGWQGLQLGPDHLVLRWCATCSEANLYCSGCITTSDIYIYIYSGSSSLLTVMFNRSVSDNYFLRVVFSSVVEMRSIWLRWLEPVDIFNGTGMAGINNCYQQG